MRNSKPFATKDKKGAVNNTFDQISGAGFSPMMGFEHKQSLDDNLKNIFNKTASYNKVYRKYNTFDMGGKYYEALLH